jgi:hypothetical protein
VKELTPEHPFFSLAAQMRMRYQAVDHADVTMLGRSDTADSVVFKLYKHFYRREYRVNL